MFSSLKSKGKKQLINIFEKSLQRLKETKDIPQYDDLTPNDDIDKDGIYAGAIRSGLENKKVHNIALTGPYGSGKSSILKTFEKNNSYKYHFLNISLATFGSEKSKLSINDSDKNNLDDRRALERSILQQMIYRVRDRTIPFSRFRKIKHQNNIHTIQQTLLFFLFIVGSFYFFVPNLFENIYENTVLYNSEASFSQLGSLLLLGFISVYGLFMFKHLYKMMRGNLNLNKLTIANASIEMDKVNDDNSIFDKFIDEILYFFQATKYDVVVFEDLDRFNSIDIFEQLRELNALINNSDLVKRDVVFIYAIKDDFFGKVDTFENTRNRTKFFDFIIPVIPILHASNSVEILNNKLRNSPYLDDIDSNFLQDVSLYVDDMRVLKNIYTEFDIYKKKLGGDLELDTNKLLGVIIYKNLYPADFSQLQYNQGFVIKMLKQKDLIIENQVSSYDEKIKLLEQKIEAAKEEHLTSIEELQSVYLQKLNNRTSQNFNYHIRINDNHYGNHNSIITNEIFEELRNATTISFNISGTHRNNASIDEIATVFGVKENYFKREESVYLKKEEDLNVHKQKILKLKRKKTEAFDLSLKEVILNNSIDIFSVELEDKDLLIYLLRHGYIDETYQHYISYFYPGTLTKVDMDFILSIKNLRAREFSYPLQQVQLIISRLKTSEFKQVEVLNYDLLEFILENKDQYIEHYNLILSQLTDGKHESLQFIIGFKERTLQRHYFISSLCNYWDDMWVYLENESNLSDEEIKKFLSEILLFANVTDIIRLNKDNKLRAYIELLEDYLKISENVPLTKEIDFLDKLEVKFKNTAQLRSNKELHSNVVDKNLYRINKQTLSDILQVEGIDLTYSTIKSIDEVGILNYIENNINVFVSDVLLDEAIIYESEKTIVQLLNSNSLRKDLKERIIEQQNLLIEDITVLDQELWEVLFKERKLKIRWYNVQQYFSIENTLDDTLINYLNYFQNAEELAKYHLEDELMNEDEQSMLSDEIIRTKSIKKTSFEKLTVSIIKWDSYPTEDLSEERVRILIKNRVLSLSLENYENIKANHSDLLILYIKENIISLLEHQEDFICNLKDFERVFNSNISIKHKVKLIEQVNAEIFSDSKEVLVLAEKIVELIFNQNIKVSTALVDAFLSYDMKQSIKLMLLVSQIKGMDQDKITENLKVLGSPYSEITEGRKRPSISNTELNRSLLVELNSKDYISQYKLERKRDAFRIFTYNR